MFVWVTLGEMYSCASIWFLCFNSFFFIYSTCESISLSRCQFVCLSIGGKDGEIVQRFSGRPKRLCTHGKSFGQNHQSDSDGTWHLCCDTRMLVVLLFTTFSTGRNMQIHACRIVTTCCYMRMFSFISILFTLPLRSLRSLWSLQLLRPILTRVFSIFSIHREARNVLDPKQTWRCRNGWNIPGK